MQNYVLGVKILSDNKEGVLRQVRDFVVRGRKFRIFSINPEIVVIAQKNLEFKSILNTGEINLADGSGLKLASSKLIILKGRQILDELCRLANKKGWKVFLLGGKNTLKAMDALKHNFQKLNIEGAIGPQLDVKGVPVSEVELKKHKDILDRINKYTPKILFVGFGAPKQEYWINRWLSKLNIVGAMVVGGSFDFLAGEKSLSPKFFPEWLWRLIQEPRRISRIFNAVIVFPLKLWFSR